MPSHDEIFFPVRADRPDWNFVLHEFPFPIALTCRRLLEVIERQEPVAAIWAMRDAFEAALKFTASLAAADLLNERAETTTLQKVAGLLMKPSGLSAGDWHSLLTLSLEPLAPLAAAGRLADSGRLLPELYLVFFQTVRQMTGKPKPTPLNLRIDGGSDSYVHWRNTVIGHGVFKQERALYARDVQTWLTHLHAFYEALRPVFQGWKLMGTTPGEEEIVWQGTGDTTQETAAQGIAAPDAAGLAPHRHQPWGNPLPMFFARASSEPPANGLAPRLPFGPLLSIQQCAVCRQPAAFFFDKHQIERDKKQIKEDKHTTDFLEYCWGESRRLKDWPEARQYAAYLPADFHWERTAFQSSEIDRALEQVLHRFDQEYVRPEYLIERLTRLVEEQDRGYLHLVAGEGFGKTYFIRGLDEEEARVLVHHVQPGALADYQVFLTEINNQARRKDKLGLVTLDAQVNEKTLEAAQGQFADYLQELARKSGEGPLIIAIDGLDELADPEKGSAAITDLLPPADQLPPKLFFLLTSRETLRPEIRKDLERLRAQSRPLFTTISVGSQDTGNQDLLRDYLRKRLPVPFRSETEVEEVLRLSYGIFLYAFHQCSALEEGAFPDVASLPEAGHFYSAYLDRLRAQVDQDLFEDVYLKTLLLLCAARQPVSARQLQQWGVPQDKLASALFDLRSFLRVHRSLSWENTLSDDDADAPFYEMAHEAFLRFVERDAVLAPELRAAHEAIARHALAEHGGNWGAVDPMETAALYDLRFLLQHLEHAGMTDEMQALWSNEHYASACFSAGYVACHAAHFSTAIALLDPALTVYRFLVEAGRTELANDLAGALNNKGSALRRVGRLPEALDCHEEAIAIRRSLVEAGRTELMDDMARALTSKGSALQQSGRLPEALDCFEEAIAIRRSLVEAGRTELMDDLAGALNNRGIALDNLGRLLEALDCYEEAIAILRFLVEAGRTELANDLVSALMNRGIALKSAGRLPEALDCHEEAIAIRRFLVEAGRTELMDDLAGALTGKGNALRSAGRLPEALDCFEEALTVYRFLVEAGRTELIDDLASALMNKGMTLHDKGSELFQDGSKARAFPLFRAAIDCFSEGIEIWRQAIQENDKVFLLPNFLGGLNLRFDLFARLGEWENAAGDVSLALEAALPFLESDSPFPEVGSEFVRLLHWVDDLQPEWRAKLDAALGEQAAAVVQQHAEWLG